VGEYEVLVIIEFKRSTLTLYCNGFYVATRSGLRGADVIYTSCSVSSSLRPILLGIGDLCIGFPSILLGIILSFSA